MKGRLLKKAAILALSAVLVTGGVPLQPIAEMAREFSVTASAETTTRTVSYIDENGQTQTVTATVLDEERLNSKLTGGWYVTSGVEITHAVELSNEDIKIILLDNETLNINLGDSSSTAFGDSGGTLRIYGQENGTGSLVCRTGSSSNSARGIGIGNYYQYGGKVTAVGYEGLSVNNICSVSGGLLNAEGQHQGLYCGQAQISGGNVSVIGNEYVLYAGKDITVSGGYLSVIDHYTGSSNYGAIHSNNGNIVFSGGDIFISAGNGETAKIAVFAQDKNITLSGAYIELQNCYYGFYSYSNINITGGHIKATQNCSVPIQSNKDLTISGGTVDVKGSVFDIYSSQYMNITGGQITATGEGVLAPAYPYYITIGYSSANDFINAKSFNGTVKIAEGLSIKDSDGNIYSDTLTDAQISAISGKKLVPNAAAYAVSLASGIRNGNVTLDKTTALKGETVTVTAVPNTNYILKSISYNDGTDHTLTPVNGVCSFSMPEKAVTVYAVFEQNIFTVTWKNYDGSTLKTDAVEYGNTPSYSGITPTKAGNAQYTYTFSGWSPAVSAVTSDTTYTAQFSSTVNKYTVTWKNADGTVLETDTKVSYGATPSYDGNTPTKAGNSKYTYTFNGWTPTVSAVKGDAEYTATFTSTPKSYTVTYMVDGEVYGAVDTVAYGTALTLREAPKKTGYTFSGWSDIPATMPDENVVVTGTFTVKSHTVTYKLDGVTYGEVDTVDYGTALTARDYPEARTGYTFSGWSEIPETMPDHDVVITGTFTANTYTVHFDKNYDNVGGTMADQSFTYDEEAKALTANAFHSTTGEFIKWNTEPDGSGKDFADGERVQNLTEENGGTVTLYAQWHKQYRIFYDDSILVCAVNGNDNEKYWAYQGDTVRINVVDNTHEYTISVVDENGESIDYDADSYTFVMPEGKVWITTTSVKRIVYTDILLDNFDSWEDVAYIYDAAHPTVTPSVTVKDGETTLTENIDYTLSITNNTGSPTEMVTAVVTITGIGGYVGTNTKEFRITPFNIADCELKGRLEAYDDGYGVYYPLCNNVEVWSGDTQLEIDNDYSLELIYPESGEFEVGQTYQAIIKGSGDWGGTKTFEFTVIELAHTVVFDPNGGTGEIASDTATKGQHYYLPECTFTAPAGFVFDYWEVSCEPGEEKQPDDYFTAPYIWSESDVQTITVKAVWKDVTGTQLAGHTLILGDDIGVNFYMELAASVLDDDSAYMLFTLPNGTTKKVMVKDVRGSVDTVSEKTYYIFPCEVAAKEMTAPIYAQIYIGDKAAGTRYEYTVKQYADHIVANSDKYSTETVELVKSMLVYGGYAQRYFGFAGTGYADADISGYTVPDITGFENAKNEVKAPTELTYYGSSLVLRSKTVYKLYFKSTQSDVTQLPDLVNTSNSAVYKPFAQTYNNTVYVCYEITGISPQDIRKNISLKFGTDGEQFTVNIDEYARLTMNDTTADNTEKMLIKALYNYRDKAAAYVQSLNGGKE